MKKILPISGAIVAGGAIAYFIYQYCKRKNVDSVFDDFGHSPKKKKNRRNSHFNAKHYGGPSAHIM